jgi:hypothetical protein
MAQQTRRAPGRPKKTQETTVVEQPVTKVVSKKPPIRQKTEEVTHRIYEISRGGGVVTILRQKEIQIYDEESGQIRNLRYCPRENSPYVDEQSENSVREAVIFRDGRLLVPKEKPNLMKFLDLHPENQANGGHLFKLIDDKKDAEQELAKEFSQSEAIMMVREKDIQDLLPVAIYYGININRATSEIRYDLLQTAKKNPTGFIQAFDSPEVTTRAMITQAGDYQIINLKKSGVYWFDSNQMIVSVPAGMEPVDVMTRFCLTEKGAAVLSTLEDKLEKLG